MTTPEGRREAVNPFIQGCGNQILQRLLWLQRADQTGKAGSKSESRRITLSDPGDRGCRAAGGGQRGARGGMTRSGTIQRRSGQDEDRTCRARDREGPAGGFQPPRGAGPRGEGGVFHWADAAAGQLSHRQLSVCVQLRAGPWTEITGEGEVTQERARMEKGRPSR